MPILNEEGAMNYKHEIKTLNLTEMFIQGCPGGNFGKCPITRYKVTKVVKKATN
jgi:hypothetical protein